MIDDPGNSKLWLRRFGPAFVFFHTGAGLMGAYFGSVVALGGSPITEELYGPVVYSISALAWCVVQALLSAVMVAGALLQGRVGGGMMALGGLLATVFYLFLSVAASLASQGTIVQAGAMFTYASTSLVTFFAGVGALRNGR